MKRNWHITANGKSHKLRPYAAKVCVYVDGYLFADLAGERCRGDAEQWLFFVPRQEREARGGRPSRTTGLGYWKATGSPGPVFSPDNRVIGVKKTMVFYIGKAPTGRKTKWKMNEYKGIDETASVSTIPKVPNYI